MPEQIETLGYLYSRSLNPAITFDRVELGGDSPGWPSAAASAEGIGQPGGQGKTGIRAKIQQRSSRLGALRAGQGVHCSSCGYDLSFNQSGNCPECGSAISPTRWLKDRRDAARPKSGPGVANRPRRPRRGGGGKQGNRDGAGRGADDPDELTMQGKS